MVNNIVQDRRKAKITIHTNEYNPRNKEIATDGQAKEKEPRLFEGKQTTP